MASIRSSKGNFKIAIPLLVVQGTTDIQASLGDAKRLTDGNPAAKLFLIEGMNHVLKTVPNERNQQVSSYSDPKLPLAPELVSEIGGFVKSIGQVGAGTN